MIYAINFWAVLVATIVAFLFGWLWYSKTVFGGIWMKLVKPSKNNSPALSMIAGFITMFITTYVLGMFIVSTDNATFAGGVLVALVVWIGLSLMKSLGEMIWQDKSAKLFWIALFHDLISFLIIGAILGAWL